MVLVHDDDLARIDGICEGIVSHLPCLSYMLLSYSYPQGALQPDTMIDFLQGSKPEIIQHTVCSEFLPAPPALPFPVNVFEKRVFACRCKQSRDRDRTDHSCYVVQRVPRMKWVLGSIRVWSACIDHHYTIDTVPPSTALLDRALNRTDESNVMVTPILLHWLPAVSQNQVLGLSPERRFNEVSPRGARHRQHAQVDTLTQLAHQNESTSGVFPSYSAISTAKYSAAVPADMMQGPLTYSHRDSVASSSLYPVQLPSSAALQDNLYSNTFPHRHASPDTPYHSTDHTLLPQGTSLAVPGPLRQERPVGQRERVADPKAAERLRCQRQSDEEHIENLYKLFVPDSEREVPKRDRLRLSTSQCLCLSS